jgi:Resolvase, N terminal domain
MLVRALRSPICLAVLLCCSHHLLAQTDTTHVTLSGTVVNTDRKPVEGVDVRLVGDTARQGVSGLGLEAQRDSVMQFLNGGNWKMVSEFVEIESGRRSDRPQLADALIACRLHGATLVVAKLDRLARDAHFLLGLKEAGVEFICVDVPWANRLTVLQAIS